MSNDANEFWTLMIAAIEQNLTMAAFSVENIIFWHTNSHIGDSNNWSYTK